MSKQNELVQFSRGALGGGSKNLIINGAMQVAQKGAQVTGKTTNGYFTVDRMLFAPSNFGTWTVDQSTDSPDGFSNSFKVTCTTANSSPIANANLSILYRIEGQDLQQLAYGTSSAKTITISFYVKSNKSGNASFEIQQEDNSDKQVTPQYTINAANTWEYKTITITGDTAGVIDNDTGIGLNIRWWLNSGSTFYGGSHRTTYTAEDNTDRNVSNLGVGGAVSDYFAITGVQLEVNDTATDFEHRSYSDELARCQRYFQKHTNDYFLYTIRSDDDSRRLTCPFPTTMRAIPSITLTTSNLDGASSIVTQGITINGVRWRSSGQGVGDAPSIAEFTADAEL